MPAKRKPSPRREFNTGDRIQVNLDQSRIVAVLKSTDQFSTGSSRF